MRFARPAASRPSRETVVPMINVVFLLLIFFLMTAVFVPPAPVDVTLPHAEAAGQAGTAEALYLAANGTLAFGRVTGASAVRRAAATGEAVDLRADAAVPAARLAEVLVQLARAGVRETRLITARP